MAVPGEMPVIDPPVTVTVLVPLVDHVVPVTMGRVVVLPSHTVTAPTMGAGNGLTVMVFVVMQPVLGMVYDTTTTPADTPVTPPDTVMVASPEEIP